MSSSAIGNPLPHSLSLRPMASRAGRGRKLKVGSTLHGDKGNMREDSEIAKSAILFLCLGNICRSPLAEGAARAAFRSEEHTSELQSLMRTSYAVFCLKKKTTDMN